MRLRMGSEKLFLSNRIQKNEYMPLVGDYLKGQYSFGWMCLKIHPPNTRVCIGGRSPTFSISVEKTSLDSGNTQYIKDP